MAGKIQRFFKNLRARSEKIYILIKQDVRKRPLTNFYLCLAVLLLLIILSNALQTPPKATQTNKPTPKQVSFYSIGSVPKMTVQAQVEKSGIVKIVALSGGIVQQLNFHEGDVISQGSTLISLSTNYQGGNASSVQRELAQNQYQSILDTFGIQTDLIREQRNIATASAQNADQLRHIGDQSRDTTSSLVNINQSMLDNLNASLAQLQNNPQADPTMIASLQSQRTQLLAGLAQGQSALNNANYQSNDSNPPAQLSALQKDLTLKQLDLQEKMLGVNKEASRLQLDLAQVTEALMFPASPVNGTVQRIFVHAGDVVTPGELLAVIAQTTTKNAATAIAYVPAEIAGKISKIEPSILKTSGQTAQEHPYFISSEAVQGNSYAVYYVVPENFTSTLTDKGYIDIQIPIGYVNTTSAATYVPVDSIYQTSDSAYLFIADHGKAKSRKVNLGDIFGSYIGVSGLHDGDQVILTRNVVDGDPIQMIK